MSFPNGSSAGLDGISPPVLKDVTAKSNGQIGLNFLRALTSLVDESLEGKILFELRLYFFGAKLIALKKPDGGLRPIAVGNTLPGYPQNAPNTMSSNHVRQDTETDK